MAGRGGMALDVERDKLFTLWTGTTSLLVFSAGSFREARELSKSEDLLKVLRRATVIGRPSATGLTAHSGGSTTLSVTDRSHGSDGDA